MSQSPSTLRQLVQRAGPLDCKRAARYVEEVAREVADLHRTGRLHPDIRPETILLDEAGTARLDLVRSRSQMPIRDVGLESENVEEIADYLAPDRALNSVTADCRADTYSLGCVLYFMLVGRAPFPTGTISERLLMHQVGTPDALRTVRPEVPLTLAQMCEKMMTKKPADRYQSADELLNAIAFWRKSVC